MDIRIVERSLNGRKRWIITNGCKNRHERYRACVVDQYAVARALNHVDRRGAEWRRSSHQIAYEGDYVLYHANEDDHITVFELRGGELIRAAENDRRGILRHVPLVLEDWLESDDDNESSILPAGYGWDGERTGSEISKFDRIEGFFKRSNVPTSIRQLVKPYILETKGVNMSTSWKQAHLLPEALREGGTWVVWTKYNNPIVIDAPIKEHPLPQRLTRAMFIRIDKNNYTVDWTLYSQPQGVRR